MLSRTKTQAAGIAFLSRAGHLLMHLRGHQPGLTMPDMWDIIGGVMEGSETPAEAAIREAEEEIGERVSTLEEFGTYESRTVRLYVFTARLDKPAEELVLGEGVALAFLSLRRLSELPLVPWTHMLVHDLKSAGLLR